MFRSMSADEAISEALFKSAETESISFNSAPAIDSPVSGAGVEAPLRQPNKNIETIEIAAINKYKPVFFM